MRLVSPDKLLVATWLISATAPVRVFHNRGSFSHQESPVWVIVSQRQTRYPIDCLSPPWRLIQLLVEMEESTCIHCAKILASSFSEMRLAFNAAAEVKEAYAEESEDHD